MAVTRCLQAPPVPGIGWLCPMDKGYMWHNRRAQNSTGQHGTVGVWCLPRLAVLWVTGSDIQWASSSVVYWPPLPAFNPCDKEVKVYKPSSLLPFLNGDLRNTPLLLDVSDFTAFPSLSYIMQKVWPLMRTEILSLPSVDVKVRVKCDWNKEVHAQTSNN